MFNILLSFTLIWKELGIKNIWSIMMIIGIVYLRYKIEEINKNNNELRKKIESILIKIDYSVKICLLIF